MTSGFLRYIAEYTVTFFLTLSNQTPRHIRKCIGICNKTSGTEISYSQYRIALHKMSGLDEISDSGIEMYSYGEAGITVFKILINPVVGDILSL